MESLIYKKIMALSWKEPYGTLMLHGKIETRSWKTNYRGLVLICASKKSYNIDSVFDISNNIDIINRVVPVYDKYPLTEGKAIAIGKLIECRPMKEEDEKKAFVKYYPDLFSWIFEDVKAIEPFAWKGSLGFRELTFEEKQKIILL
ncbi:MAG: hypothetical protein WC358_00080 [Ignavibacteria bacterium]|jgi:hypothetical protein